MEPALRQALSGVQDLRRASASTIPPRPCAWTSRRADFTPSCFRRAASTTSTRIGTTATRRTSPTTSATSWRRTRQWECGVQDRGFDASEVLTRLPAPARPTGATLRVYRLALGATAEYTAAVSGTNPGTVAQALAAMVTSINRCSAVYERDLAIRFVLVNNTDKLVYTDPSDRRLHQQQRQHDAGREPVEDRQHHRQRELRYRSRLQHGRRRHREPRRDLPLRSKGAGRDRPGQSDRRSVRHRLRGARDGPPIRREPSVQRHDWQLLRRQPHGATAYEPGSGTTIMAYAGICSPQDLAPHSDDYFHTISYDEIDTYTSSGSGSTCPTTISTGNHPPVIAALTNFTIPVADALCADRQRHRSGWRHADLLLGGIRSWVRRRIRRQIRATTAVRRFSARSIPHRIRRGFFRR